MPWLLALQGEGGLRGREWELWGAGPRSCYLAAGRDQAWARGKEKGRALRSQLARPRRTAPHPGCRSGGLGIGLLKPRLPTSQYVSSAPLPWEDTGRGGLRRAGARAGGSRGLRGPGDRGDRGDRGRARPAMSPARAQRGAGGLTFSSVRPRTSVWKPWSRARRIRTVLTFTWMR